MAGNKINTKGKGKEDKSKANKGVTQTNEETEDLDFALLRKPINTSITSFAQARRIFDCATEELKDLLSNECDILYECKVCRNIFRSLANFISHKRVYCKEKFNSTVHAHFVKAASTVKELLKIKRTEDGYQESLKEKNRTVLVDLDEADDRIPLTKDLTAVVEKITKVKGIQTSNNEDLQQVVLQKIPNSSIAVFQNVNNVEELENGHMRAQVKELDNILTRDKAVLQSDGKFTIESSKESDKSAPDTDAVIQISDDDDSGEGEVLKCKICDLQFSTQKTLKFHMKYKHVESRLVYPCPDCLEIFSTSWSVYRHLYKVHRKTAAQIRRLRESIQAKAFRMNNPPMFYEKRKNTMKPAPAQKITEEERLDQENQAWMDNLEGDGELPRCGGCGRTFERRAALAAHTHTCQPRSRALARRPEGKKIEIQIRKDYNKGPVSGLTLLKPADQSENKATNDDIRPIIKSQNEIGKTNEVEIDDNDKEQDDKDKEQDDEAPMDIGDDEPKSNDSAASPDQTEDTLTQIEFKPAIKLPFALQAEKSNLAAYRQRIRSEIEFSILLCKKCNTKCNSPPELFEHMAEHFKWMRYACKLCNFKHFKFEKLPEHVKIVHKLKGDTDFYFSTVKAIDGTEAMIISRCLVEAESTDDIIDANETSPDSRRPSRCSSDSSRLSDESSPGSTLKESGSRKRKSHPHWIKPKRKKESIANEDGDEQNGDLSREKVMKVILGDNDISSNIKAFEENSSDIDDVEEKITKRHNMVAKTVSVISRRPVRKKTKPKNEDFEYDLSNLLKMEAQGYRDSQSTTNTKTTQPKKKVQQEMSNYNDTINKDYCGAMYTLSKRAVENASAQMKNVAIFSYPQESRTANIFVRPMLPKSVSRGEKLSPRKDNTEDLKDTGNSSKVVKVAELSPILNKNTKGNKTSPEECPKNIEKDDVTTVVKNDNKTIAKDQVKVYTKENIKKNHQNEEKAITQDEETNAKDDGKNDTTLLPKSTSKDAINKEQNSPEGAKVEKKKSSLNIPSVVPIKFGRQSLDLMKNPIINKNITDFTKAGMKTKILVIKPINRNKDGTRTMNTSLKFQTIKLKDPNNSSILSADNTSDQVMVVKVPKVERAICKSVADACSTITENLTPTINMTAADSTNTNIKTTDKTHEESKPAKTVTVNNTNEDKCNETGTDSSKSVTITITNKLETDANTSEQIDILT